MSKNAANEATLGALHEKVAQVMLNALDAYTQVEQLIVDKGEDDTGNVIMAVLEPSPALLGAITKFLKDNEISCQVEANPQTSALAHRLASKERKGAKIVSLSGLPITEPDEPAKPPMATEPENDLEKLGLG